jgi:hypothetical protein
MAIDVDSYAINVRAKASQTLYNASEGRNRVSVAKRKENAPEWL